MRIASRLTRAAIAALLAIAVCGVALADPPSADKGFVTVEAEGDGPDGKSATEAALASAVAQAAGALVEQVTEIRNDAVLMDQIRQRSAGIVQKYDLLDKKFEGKRVRVRIRALVSKDQALQQVGPLIESRIKVHGSGVAAKERSIRQADADSVAGLCPSLGELLQAPFTVLTSPEAMLNSLGTDMPKIPGRYLIPVTLRVDTKSWNDRAKALCARLDTLGRKKFEERVAWSEWSLTRDECRKDLLAMNEEFNRLKALDGIRAMQYMQGRRDGAGILCSRLAEPGAVSLSIRETIHWADQAGANGDFVVCGFGRIQGAGLLKQAQSGRVAGAVQIPMPGQPSGGAQLKAFRMIAVLSEVTTTGGVLRFYEVTPNVAAELRQCVPSTPRFEIDLRDAQGGVVRELSMQSAYRLPIGADTLDFPSSQPGAPSVPALVLAPGSLRSVLIGGNFGGSPELILEHEWMGFLDTPFQMDDLGRTEEIRLRCVPSPKAVGLP